MKITIVKEKENLYNLFDEAFNTCYSAQVLDMETHLLYDRGIKDTINNIRKADAFKKEIEYVKSQYPYWRFEIELEISGKHIKISLELSKENGDNLITKNKHLAK